MVKCIVLHHTVLVKWYFSCYGQNVPLVDVLPPARVHLLAGVSDAGKTRFIIPAMLAWGIPWAYVAGDRSILDAWDAIDDMGIPRTSVPLVAAFGREHKEWFAIIQAIAGMRPLPQVIVVEGFQTLCANRNDSKAVREFLSGVDAYLGPTTEFPQGITVLGVAESSKQKPLERYADPRQRISGVSSWAYHSSTVLLIESGRKDLELLDPVRVMYVCMKRGRRRRIDGAFTNANRLEFPSL